VRIFLVEFFPLFSLYERFFYKISIISLLELSLSKNTKVKKTVFLRKVTPDSERETSGFLKKELLTISGVLKKNLEINKIFGNLFFKMWFLQNIYQFSLFFQSLKNLEPIFSTRLTKEILLIFFFNPFFTFFFGLLCPFEIKKK